MSEENVELVRTYFNVWNAGDMEGLRELYDPDAAMEATPDWPEPGPFVGRDAVMEQLNQARAAFESDSLEFLSDPVAVGEQVIVRTGWHGFGRGPQSDMEWTNVITIRAGRFINVQYIWDHAEALEAVGLWSRPPTRRTRPQPARAGRGSSGSSPPRPRRDACPAGAVGSFVRGTRLEGPAARGVGCWGAGRRTGVDSRSGSRSFRRPRRIVREGSRRPASCCGCARRGCGGDGHRRAARGRGRLAQLGPGGGWPSYGRRPPAFL
jgi:ketosteroid isomerase-like protein